MQSIISKEVEKNQQNRIAESAKLMANIEEVRAALQETLDVIMKNLADHCDLLQGQDARLEALETHVKEHQTTLSEIHASIEDCTASIVSMVATVEVARNEARDPRIMQGTEKWLGQFASQLVASGITSAMTAVVVMIAARSEGGVCEERRSSTPNPGAAFPQDGGFTSKAQSNRSSKASKFHSLPTNLSTSRTPSQSTQIEIPQSSTAAENRNAFECSLSRHDTPLAQTQTALISLLPIPSAQDEHRNSKDAKKISSNWWESMLTRDRSNQPTKTTSNSNPTKTYTSNSPRPGQSSESAPKKTKVSKLPPGSAYYSSSYFNSTTSYPGNSQSSLSSHQDYSSQTKNYNETAPRLPISQTQSTETWDCICCKCNGVTNMKSLMLFESCSFCHHNRDSSCVVKKRVTGSSKAPTSRR